MPLTFILIIISIPSPTLSFIPGLNIPFFCKSYPPFLLHNLLHGFPRLFTDTHVSFYLLYSAR